MKKSVMLSLFFLAIYKISAQPAFPEPGKVYTKTEVPEIYIYIHPDSLAYIYSHVDDDIEYHATFVFKTSGSYDSITNVGFGLRGNTSRYSQKKSFQISFNTYMQGAKFEGLEKINLNGEHNDPSIIRSRLCWDMLREFACPVSRANHVEVYINGYYYGLYINVEHIDEEFIQSRFVNNDGNLYKCLWPADLVYLGNDPDLYKYTNSGRRAYDLKINEVADDYSDLARFIDILNNIPENELHLHLDSVFNTNAFLKVLCIDILTGDWDGYAYNKNNFYLYHNTQTGKFEYLPYDLDNTFGIDWFGLDWAKRDIYNWSNTSESRPLYTRILENQTYRKRFTFYMKQLLEKFFNSTNLFPEIDAIKTMIQTSAENDYYRTYDYGWSINDFNNSYTTALGAHVKYGLKPFISERYTTAINQLETTNTAPIISYVQNGQARIGLDISVKALVEDETANPSVFVKYRLNSGSFSSIPMYDDGMHSDGIAGDRFYGALIPAVSSNTVIDYYIEATDNHSQTTNEPVSGYFTINISDQVPALFINEFMASNSKTHTDEYGEYDDWIEIYNAGNTSVYLGDKYLTDNLGSPKKWKMPDKTLEPNQFILFWADDSYLTQGEMHTNYKLSADGEEIGIFNSDADGNSQIDAIVFGKQEKDISFGRYPDAGNNLYAMMSPTPGTSNILTGINDIIDDKRIRIFPNPAHDLINIRLIDNDLTISAVAIFNGTGQKIDQIREIKTTEIEYVLDRRKINPGIYTLRIDYKKGHETGVLVRKIIVL